MLRLRPTYEQIERESRTSRLKILPEKQQRRQQGILFDDVNFDDFDLDRYNIRNRATQTDICNEGSNDSSASSSRRVQTARDGNEDKQQERREARETSRQVSVSTGESMHDVRYRTRMSIADVLATMARVGGNIIYYTGQGIGQGINMAVDAYNWWNEDDDDVADATSSGRSRDNEEENVEPPINEEVFEQIQGLMRRGASRSRSPEERESGSNQAMRLMRRGASRSRSSTPKKGKKII